MNYYEQIKNELINNEITKKTKSYSINRSDLNTYYNVGRMLSEAGKHYGEGIIKEYSKRLTNELGKGYTTSNLKRYRQFFILIQKGARLGHQLSWSQYRELIPLKDIDKINYYINICENSIITRDELKAKIKNKEYERLPESTKNKLITHEENKIEDMIKEPILIKNSTDKETISEKVLQKLILENISDFLKELGSGFTFIDYEYKIKIGNNYNYIDLFLYNIKYKCYVVVELKITELKKEHIGQIETYMNYVDKNIKTIEENKTIGIIICKKNNKFLMEYCSDSRIVAKEFSIVS